MLHWAKIWRRLFGWKWCKYQPCNMTVDPWPPLYTMSPIFMSHSMDWLWHVPGKHEGEHRPWSFLKVNVVCTGTCLLGRVIHTRNMFQEQEIQPCPVHDTLYLSTLRASLEDTGRGMVSCWPRIPRIACPLGMASPHKDHWTPGTLLLWQRQKQHDQDTKRFTTNFMDHNKLSRPGLYVISSEWQRDHPEACASGWSTLAIGAHHRSLYLSTFQCQAEAG